MADEGRRPRKIRKKANRNTSVPRELIKKAVKKKRSMVKSRVKSFVKYDIDNRLCLMMPKQIDTDWHNFKDPVIHYDTKNKKILIELEYEKCKE